MVDCGEAVIKKDSASSRKLQSVNILLRNEHILDHTNYSSISIKKKKDGLIIPICKIMIFGCATTLIYVEIRFVNYV